VSAFERAQVLAVPDDVDLPDLTAARFEAVCLGCRYLYHAPLGACPTCKELR
jgi:hypothetical protein